MFLESILALIVCSVLRKSLNTKVTMPEWDRLLVAGTVIAVLLMVLGVVQHHYKPWVMWLGHLFILILVYIVLTKKEFRYAKPFMYSLLPLIIISLAGSITELVSKKFYTDWEDYFGFAIFFAQIWSVGMWFITKKQRKALEKERLRAQEIEKENKINEKLKAALEIQVAERTASLTLQKKELEQTLTELQVTQKQLIQSEKMASLGELTAGIAHEIQNPLNFVNNFSEINAELLAEMKDELANGNIEEAIKIADDINDNEKKIIFHGKRADSIVKGMLQHSRSSSGIKEPTNINALADEYLRLAYHGLRAKDKSFNAIMKTNYDESIGNITIIPQDMGRVILNLITNAFYAVTERKKQQAGDYEPTVTVTTKKLAFPMAGGNGSKVEICVKDNGNGIPQKVLDKIFQPFFTTKPTGQGTGLGLSMSYDIVTKGHNGELKVENKEGEGATFIIILPV